MAATHTKAVQAKGASGATGSAGSTTPPATTTTQTKPAKGLRLQLQQMLTGLQTVFPSDASISTSGASNTGTVTIAALIQQVQSGLAQYSAVDTAELAQTQARAELAGDLVSLKSQYAAMKAALVFYFGASSPQLAQFGLKPKTARAKPSAKTLVAAQEKGQQTKALRGTHTKASVADVQFAGTVAVSTEVSAPVAPAAAPAVAPAAAPAPAAATPEASPKSGS